MFLLRVSSEIALLRAVKEGKKYGYGDPKNNCQHFVRNFMVPLNIEKKSMLCACMIFVHEFYGTMFNAIIAIRMLQRFQNALAAYMHHYYIENSVNDSFNHKYNSISIDGPISTTSPFEVANRFGYDGIVIECSWLFDFPHKKENLFFCGLLQMHDKDCGGYNIKKCPASGNGDKQGANRNPQQSSNGNSNSDGDDANGYNNHNGDGHNHRKNSSSGDDEKDPDDQKSNNQQENQLHQYQSKLQKLKQHPNYKMMQQKNMTLTDQELIALIYYCDSLSIKNKMQPLHKGVVNEKWKEYYHHIAAGVTKLYHVFHFKNEHQNRIKYLFNSYQLSQLNNCPIASFSTQFSDANS